MECSASCLGVRVVNALASPPTHSRLTGSLVRIIAFGFGSQTNAGTAVLDRSWQSNAKRVFRAEAPSQHAFGRVRCDILLPRHSTSSMTGIASNLQVVENDTQSPLHDLPIELLEWILPYLESEDLFSLRLASRELATKTVQYMAKTYFTWLHIFMLDSSGISRLT